jgi:hypothetical protein
MTFQRAWLRNLRAASPTAALFLMMGLGLSLTACVGDTSTPKETIQTAAYDAAHGKFDDWKAVLTGDALARYGSPAGLDELRGRVGKLVTIGDPRLVSHLQGDQGGGSVGDVLRTYRSDVSALTPHGTPIAVTVETRCSLQVETIHDDGSPGACSLDPNDPGGPDLCQPDTPASDHDEVVQSCLVSGIAMNNA